MPERRMRGVQWLDGSHQREVGPIKAGSQNMNVAFLCFVTITTGCYERRHEEVED